MLKKGANRHSEHSEESCFCESRPLAYARGDGEDRSERLFDTLGVERVCPGLWGRLVSVASTPRGRRGLNRCGYHRWKPRQARSKALEGPMSGVARRFSAGRADRRWAS